MNSRREFLKLSALLAASFAVPVFPVRVQAGSPKTLWTNSKATMRTATYYPADFCRKCGQVFTPDELHPEVTGFTFAVPRLPQRHICLDNLESTEEGTLGWSFTKLKEACDL